MWSTREKAISKSVLKKRKKKKITDNVRFVIRFPYVGKLFCLFQGQEYLKCKITLYVYYLFIKDVSNMSLYFRRVFYFVLIPYFTTLHYSYNKIFPISSSKGTFYFPYPFVVPLPGSLLVQTPPLPSGFTDVCRSVYPHCPHPTQWSSELPTSYLSPNIKWQLSSGSRQKVHPLTILGLPTKFSSETRHTCYI